MTIKNQVAKVGRPKKGNLSATTTGIRLETDIQALLEQEAKSTGQSVADVVRRVLRERYKPEVEPAEVENSDDDNNSDSGTPTQNEVITQLINDVQSIKQLLTGFFTPEVPEELQDPTEEQLQKIYQDYCSTVESDKSALSFEAFRDNSLKALADKRKQFQQLSTLDRLKSHLCRHLENLNLKTEKGLNWIIQVVEGNLQLSNQIYESVCE